jgi:hypothetical protein
MHMILPNKSLVENTMSMLVELLTRLELGELNFRATVARADICLYYFCHCMAPTEFINISTGVIPLVITPESLE